MQELDGDLWVHEAAIGPGASSRMTIVRLIEGGLWIHSPTNLTGELHAQVKALGRVDAIVAPNNGHHMFIEQWTDAFPGAGLYVARGVPAKHPSLTDFELIEDVGSELWSQDFKIAVMSGVPLSDECVFLHRPSRSLIVADAVQNWPPPNTLAGKLFFAPMGWRGICPPPPTKFDFIVHDRDALLKSLDEVRGWSFDRIILSHGDIIEDEASSVFEAVYQQLKTARGNRLHGLLMKFFLNRLIDGGVPIRK